MINQQNGIEQYIASYKGFFDETLYKIAYEQLKSKPGNMTPGIDAETLDGMSLE